MIFGSSSTRLVIDGGRDPRCAVPPSDRSAVPHANLSKTSDESLLPQITEPAEERNKKHCQTLCHSIIHKENPNILLLSFKKKCWRTQVLFGGSLVPHFGLLWYLLPLVSKPGYIASSLVCFITCICGLFKNHLWWCNTYRVHSGQLGKRSPLPTCKLHCWDIVPFHYLKERLSVAPPAYPTPPPPVPIPWHIWEEEV